MAAAVFLPYPASFADVIGLVLGVPETRTQRTRKKNGLFPTHPAGAPPTAFAASLLTHSLTISFLFLLSLFSPSLQLWCARYLNLDIPLCARRTWSSSFSRHHFLPLTLTPPPFLSPPHSRSPPLHILATLSTAPENLRSKIQTLIFPPFLH
ncbi:uncharacterized protein BO66DRAFT_255231 [Aspergillus aculeatinus CBS 121060]|uniref:Uncharacterized protein n=1 Tax=Aspergillus aculeatinus CBS 121060 TaxID=1448322 RepID=A0ACD1GSC0_9EURO|nr:hypothetical protein BO66DRAFT_255231 [Aspergillus aculeatinus CBS 121060]RAH64080.1 hypothetical protein BO66DRAFT_255231 [Aspergillus aculeatinus CBS 121060]